jgi:hypothetical protein
MGRVIVANIPLNLYFLEKENEEGLIFLKRKCTSFLRKKIHRDFQSPIILY